MPATPRHASVQYMARNRLDRATPRATLYQISPAVAGLRSLPRCTSSAGNTYTGRYLQRHIMWTLSLDAKCDGHTRWGPI